ncbi:MAG: carbon-nitrogen hydrolase family protein [Spirochaetota bacterium]|nr:carbon-nitrogen hydrolase family protein [Spirochaetota bacterium]
MDYTIVMYQYPLGTYLTHNTVNKLRNIKPHFLCFPEYFFVNKKLGNHVQTPHNQSLQLKRMQVLSKELDTVVIGGTMPELNGNYLHNTTFVFHNGTMLGFYRKQNLFFAEEGKITPGNSHVIFTAYGIRFSVLICADVFKDENFIALKELGAQIIFIPTFSLMRNETVEEKFKRDQDIFVRGAQLANAILVKVCGVKSDYKNFLQARSLIASPDGILYRVEPDQEDKAMLIVNTVSL